MERAKKMTLRSFEGRIFERHQTKRTTPWIMSVDVYHRLRLKFGLQFCSMCLSEGEPYFRRKWRLAFVTSCEKHKKLLLDRCPYCMSALNFHRLKLRDGQISICFNCRKDLAHVSRYQRNVDPREVAVQIELKKIMHRGWLMIDKRPVYSHLFFSVYHQLCRLVMHAFRTNKWANLKGIPGYQIDDYFADHRYFEDLPVISRKATIIIVGWLLEDWPNRFREFCSENRIYRSLLAKDFRTAPFWYLSVINNFLYKPDYHFSDLEVVSAIEYLKAMHFQVTERKLDRILGTRQAFKNREHLKRISSNLT